MHDAKYVHQTLVTSTIPNLERAFVNATFVYRVPGRSICASENTTQKFAAASRLECFAPLQKIKRGTAQEVLLQNDFNPGRADKVNTTIRVLRVDRTQYPAKVVTLALDPPASNQQPIARVAARSWQVDVMELAQGGTWTVRVIITSERDTLGQEAAFVGLS